MKKKIYKKIYKYLSWKWSLFNDRIDYLRIWVNELNTQISSIFEKNIEDNIWGFNLNIAGMDFLVIKSKTVLWEVVFLSTSININWINIMINSARILKLRNNMRKWNRYLIDIYWQTFRLSELININLDNLIDNLSNDNQKFIKRIDYASDFIVEDAEATIRRIDRNTNKVKKINYLNESLAIWLYDKKWRANWKVKYNLTKRLWIRVYNKVKNILDLGYWAFYEEYLDYNIVRLEGMLWSEVCKKIYFWCIENIKEQAVELLLWFKPLYNHNQVKNNSITVKYLWKMSSDIGSRLWTYMMNWWDIKKIKLWPDSISLSELLGKIENNDDEILF